MPSKKPTAPEARLGVFKQLSDVPDAYRFDQYEDEYAGRDVFTEYLEAEVLPTDERTENTVRREARRWTEYVESERGRHHALCRPVDVEVYAGRLLQRYAMQTAWRYWSRVERFYRWLMWHAEHLHTYCPPIMAAALGGPSAEIWDYKLNRF